MTDKTELEVTQRAREAAADYAKYHGWHESEEMRSGKKDDMKIVQSFARFERDILATRTPDPTPVAWMPIESAPKDEPILAAIKVQNNRTGASWWERHIIVIDSETGAISDMDYHHGWEADDYEGWQHLPPAPGDMLATRTPDPTPVAWMYQGPECGCRVKTSRQSMTYMRAETETPLYTHPPAVPADGLAEAAEMARVILMGVRPGLCMKPGGKVVSAGQALDALEAALAAQRGEA